MSLNSLFSTSQPTSLLNLFKTPVNKGVVTTAPVPMRTQSLPNGAGSYSTPSGQAPTAPVITAPTTGGTGPTLNAVYTGKNAPVTNKKVTAPVSTNSNKGVTVPQQWVKPDGTFYTPQEIAANIANAAPGAPNGDIPKFAGDTLSQGPQTTEQLQQSAAGLNNSRNDIAVGETDPYKVASASGIAYTPQELSAIEKAYAGIYDPAINDALSKLNTKQKQDAATADLKNQLALQAQKHKDDLELKRTPDGSAFSSIGNGSAYVPGSNPTVDAWVTNINSGKSKMSDIKDATLKNLVTQGLSQTKSSGNDILAATNKAVSDLNDMVTNNHGFEDAVGAKGLGGGLLFGKVIPGSAASDFNSKLNQVISGPVLDNLNLLKGMGRVTQTEFDTLKSAITSLNNSESEDQFKKDLKTLTDFVALHPVNSTNSSTDATGSAPQTPSAQSSTGILVTDPDGGMHVFPTQSQADAFKKAIGQ